eukprot:366039-Chlamydomonas_euryale.AAC.8
MTPLLYAAPEPSACLREGSMAAAAGWRRGLAARAVGAARCLGCGCSSGRVHARAASYKHSAYVRASDARAWPGLRACECLGVAGVVAAKGCWQGCESAPVLRPAPQV